MTQRGEEFAKLPAEPSPRRPGGRAGGHSWVPGTLSPRPPPRRGVGGGPHLSTPLSLAPAGGRLSGLGQTGRVWALPPPSLCFPLLPPPSFPDVQRKRSEKESEKGSGEFPNEEKNHLRREEGACICVCGGLPRSFREETLGSEETGDTLGIWPTGIPLAFLGHWVPGFLPAGFETQELRYRVLPGSLI